MTARALPPDCGGTCSLTAVIAGTRAEVVQVRCAAADACRLGALGIYEGTRLVVLDARHGVLLDVRGTRLGLDGRTAAAIVVRPVGGP